MATFGDGIKQFVATHFPELTGWECRVEEAGVHKSDSVAVYVAIEQGPIAELDFRCYMKHDERYYTHEANPMDEELPTDSRGFELRQVVLRSGLLLVPLELYMRNKRIAELYASGNAS